MFRRKTGRRVWVRYETIKCIYKYCCLLGRDILWCPFPVDGWSRLIWIAYKFSTRLHIVTCWITINLERTRWKINLRFHSKVFKVLLLPNIMKIINSRSITCAVSRLDKKCLWHFSMTFFRDMPVARILRRRMLYCNILHYVILRCNTLHYIILHYTTYNLYYTK